MRTATRYDTLGSSFCSCAFMSLRPNICAMNPIQQTLYALSVTVIAAAFPSSLAADTQSERAANLAKSCVVPGTWIDNTSGAPVERTAVFADLGGKPILLLGEYHNVLDHHRWQLQTIAALHGRGAKLVLGFEMFPRRVQPVLDQWVKGELTKNAFLKAVNWREVWGFDPELYMPLFDFARMNGIPIVALNVERKLVSRVAEKGWGNVPSSEREGLGNPAAASPEYLRSLARTYAQKQAMKEAGIKAIDDVSKLPEPDEAKITAILALPEFQRFVEAQLTWDRAMAEGLASARQKYPDAIAIGIVGSGHVEHGYGIPNQLRNLGAGDSTMLIPVETGEPCGKISSDTAHLLFTVKALGEEKDERPKLGVAITPKEDGALVNGVVPNSVGAIAGIQKGDLIIRAAGSQIRSAGDLIEVVSRQAPGTWLPLTVKRGGTEIELIAKFAPGQKP
jgi:uncharacterized iron-regulated protein